jgi:hypothetical protein
MTRWNKDWGATQPFETYDQWPRFQAKVREAHKQNQINTFNRLKNQGKRGAILITDAHAAGVSVNTLAMILEVQPNRVARFLGLSAGDAA